MNEAETRAEHIDPALARAGWGVHAHSRIRREYVISPGRIEDHGRRGKVLKVDYVLEYRNHKLGVIEAKSWDEALTEGVAQAKNYAGKLGLRFTYASNGRGIYAIDMHTGVEGPIAAYPSPSQLWEMTFGVANATADAAAFTAAVWRDRFAAIPFEDKSGSHPGRYYQETAVERVLQAIGAGRQRLLLTLATGTGKTFIAFQIAWKLFQARWTLRRDGAGHTMARRPRILFLADRNILADQAYNAFSAFPEDALVRIAPSDIRKKGKVPKNGNLFFTIFQTFMSGPVVDGTPTPYFGDYPPDFFDLIIIDECHRGGANDESNWRGIMDHFAPAVQLGLTATPKRSDNADTYRYFGEPLYEYSLKDGINDGFLTPFRVKQIETTLDYYQYSPSDDVLEGQIQTGKVYDNDDFNRSIEIREREQKRVEIFLSQIQPHEKTLVFCANQAHALLVRDLINQLKRSRDPNYCQRVTANDGVLGEQFLRDFQDNEKSIPTILTTSQKLTTGVDARNVRNIVLMRLVNSMIEFKQIIGRGTRLFEGKDYFTIYDFVQAHERFNDPEWDGPSLPPPGASAPYPPRGAGVDAGDEPAHGGDDGGDDGRSRPVMVKVKLADGKARNIAHSTVTTFWHPDGRPISAQAFVELLFGKLPLFFRSEEELLALWSAPDSRAKLLQGLADHGFQAAQLAEIQKIIDAEQSDLYDVLAHVAYAAPPVPRTARAEQARAAISSHFTQKQQAFLDFVLGHYIENGVQELALNNLTALAKRKYGSTNEVVKNLGKAEDLNKVFVGFQPFLYQPGYRLGPRK